MQRIEIFPLHQSVSKVYLLEGIEPEQADWIARHLLSDPVSETLRKPHHFDWSLEVGYQPGVTDNEGKIAEETIRKALGISAHVHTARRHFLKDLSEAQRLAREVSNPLVQRVQIFPADEVPCWDYTLPTWKQTIKEVPLEGDLPKLSDEMLLALSLEEMEQIRRYFLERGKEREGLGLPFWPTDVELEAIAQTWSEHCKHKIFNDRIRYREGNCEVVIEGLFDTFIRKPTERSSRNWLVSVFEDNAGIIRWNDSHHLVFKVETHNAPSALEPYGGALTGIVGVNRDPAGTGLGAKLLFNTDVFCFAPPTWNAPLPPGILHPRRLFEGVRQGVEDGGNQSGIPTVNGALFFDERYLGRPLVFCGTGALMKKESAGRFNHQKEIHPGDFIVMAGGRVGKDGIHGATFSSEATGERHPLGVVQIGDPITQKKMLDMLAEALERGLYRAITDNGAGGLSSSVGEMAQLSGGALLELDRVPLKYPGLAPWEILVSESQERMTLAVPPEHWEALDELAKRRDVEVSIIGHFTEAGRFQANWKGAAVMGLDLEFLHRGCPRRTLEAVWENRESAVPLFPLPEMEEDLLKLLGSLNICSREGVIRQYDHEVQGGSVVKPLVGEGGPSDAAVLRPLLESDLGVTISCAINPHYGDHDPYWMAALMVDEAIRNSVAVGGDPDHLALLDNFCWPDPVRAPKNPDGREKLGKLVRACEGLAAATLGFDTPLISGKDSLKNDYHGPEKLSIPPTLLVSAIAKHPDIRKAVTMDVKAPGDLVYVLGITLPELGGSQYARLHAWPGGKVPIVDFTEARARYRALHRAILEERIASCHDCSEGGLGVCFAEMAFAGGMGLRIQLERIPRKGDLREDELLFSESSSRLVVTVPPSEQRAFEEAMKGQHLALVGVVTKEPILRIEGNQGISIDLELQKLKKAWQGGAKW
ncbi:MAG TPA: phosphoribosylformylglycinamidine synthase subunit PurL [Chroococcales cyanobacterium]